MSRTPATPNAMPADDPQKNAPPLEARRVLPLPNYTLSSVCPACGSQTFKLACKVRCARCGFMWDCSEL